MSSIFDRWEQHPAGYDSPAVVVGEAGPAGETPLAPSATMLTKLVDDMLDWIRRSRQPPPPAPTASQFIPLSLLGAGPS